MTKRQAATRHSEQPTFSMRVWPDLMFAMQVWNRVCQDTNRLPAFETIKAAGTLDGPWHTDGTINYRKLERTVTLGSESLHTELRIELVGFEIHEAGQHKSYFKWHFVSAKLIGNGEVEVWNSTQLAWMRNTPHAPTLSPDQCVYYEHERYYNAHAL